MFSFLRKAASFVMKFGFSESEELGSHQENSGTGQISTSSRHQNQGDSLNTIMKMQT